MRAVEIKEVQRITHSSLSNWSSVRDTVYNEKNKRKKKANVDDSELFSPQVSHKFTDLESLARF
jgi:hypothetical protein